MFVFFVFFFRFFGARPGVGTLKFNLIVFWILFIFFRISGLEGF